MRRSCFLVAICLVASLAAPAAAQSGPAQTLDTVRVASRVDGSLATATRSVEVLTRSDLQGRASRSLADLLGFALGVDVQQRSPAQSDLGLRGSTFNQVVVLVDGVRVSDVQSGHYALDLAMPLAMIERIEILRGTGSALYGSDAIGGVVNIVTRSDSSAAELATRFGSFGGARGSLAGAGRLGSTQLRLGADVDRSSGHRPGTDYRLTQVRGSAERTLGDARLTADLGLGVRNFGAADFYSPFPSHEDTRSSTAAVRLHAPLTDRLALSAAAHTRRHSDLFTLKREDPAFYQNAHLSWQHGLDASARVSIASGLHAVFGGELLDARLESARLGDHSERRSALFGEATLTLPAGAALNAGVRGDWSSAVESFVSPSLGIAVPLGSLVQVRASTGRGYRAPTWTERYYRDPANIGDSTLSVERFIASEVGVRITPASWVWADVALYERRARALIDWARPAGTPTTTPWRTMNFANATYRGIEAALTFPELLGLAWTVRGSGLRFDASAAPGTVGKYALRPLTRTLGLATSGRVGAGSVTLDAQRARRTGERDHFTLNARLDQPLLSPLRVSLELMNLTNDAYLDGAGKPVVPRSVYVGLSWTAR